MPRYDSIFNGNLVVFYEATWQESINYLGGREDGST